MKRYNKTATLRPSFWAVLALLMRIVINRATTYCMAQYREIEKRKPLLKLYRWELRGLYAIDDFMTRHSRLVGVCGWLLYVAFCLEMFVCCMDELCGLN